MNAQQCIASLDRTPRIIEALIESVDARVLGRPGGDGAAWSITQILCHLADEEREDFRPRLELTLREPDSPWPGIDPQGAAVSRAYDRQDPHEALARFSAAREENLNWLRALKEPNWNAVHTHPRIGEIRAGDLLASWAVHDLLHARQIVKRLFENLVHAAHPFATAYAGEWTA